MKLHPIKECMATADKLLQKHPGANVYQQWLCAHCGTKQTMDIANGFFVGGICDKCGKETDIAANGCNYMVHLVSGGAP